MKIKYIILPLLVVFLFAGAVNAQDGTLPNAGLTPESSLYFLDKLGETLREFFTFSPEGKARLQIVFATERIAEIKIVLETKGVDAKGLEVAEARLREHLGDVAEIVIKQKGNGKDVSKLAKELNDKFGDAKSELKNTFKAEKRALRAKEDKLKDQLKVARRAGDAAAVEALVQELGDIKAQLELLELKEDKLEDDLDAEEEKFEDELDAREEAEEAIKEAKEEKEELIEEAAEEEVVLPANSFSSFDNLLTQAESAYGAEDYAEARRLAKQAEDALESVDDLIDDLEDAVEEDEDEDIEENNDEDIEEADEADDESDDSRGDTESLKPAAPKTTETSQTTSKPTESAITTSPPAVTQNQCSRTFSPKFSQAKHYLGSLFDAHLHMPSIIDVSTIDTSKIEGHDGFPTVGHGSFNTDAELARLLCVFGQEKVRGAFGFVMGEEQLLNETINGIKSTKSKVGSKVNVFLSPAGFTATGLEKIEISNKGLLDGYGELSFGFGGGLKSNQFPDDQNFLDIYKVAGGSNLIVMIHVGAQQQSMIENMLQKNPNVTFLFHGPESENFIHNVIAKYPNAYYSIDAMLIRLPGAPGALMYMVNSKDEFKQKFSQNYKTMLDNTVNQWKSKIEQYPDRYMWGTDRYGEWTYDEDVSALIEEFGRAFIGRLDSAVQERFAYKNAENLLEL